MAVTSIKNSSISDFVKFRNMSATFGARPFSLQYVVVAGGGGGGNNFGGAGGAGGYRSNVTGENTGGGLAAESDLTTETPNSRLPNPGTYQVTVGGGGAAGIGSGNPGLVGNNSVFGSITANGGGRGGGFNVSAAGGSGGSGGGSAFTNTTTSSGTVGQGFGSTGGGGSGGSGGGGAGALGADGGNDGGNGGVGVASSITGSAVVRAGGGGGGGNIGGLGFDGGGNGGSSGVVGAPGTVNTGGGGGGGGGGDRNGGTGASGVVILSIPTQAPLATFSAGVTQTSVIVGPHRVYTITATSTTNETVTIL